MTTARSLAAALALAIAACGGGDQSRPGEAAAACRDCHATQARAIAEHVSSHALLFDCSFCHAQLAEAHGPGHREIRACAECHSEQTHPSRTGGSDSRSGCERCHAAHGTANLFLIRTELTLRDGTTAPIDFTSLAGRADASFAELPSSEGGVNGREPGAGLCEVCHAGTRFYDAAGTGEAHPVQRCTKCHDHARAFLPTGAGR